jgi:micrococcal nuclease
MMIAYRHAERNPLGRALAFAVFVLAVSVGTFLPSQAKVQTIIAGAALIAVDGDTVKLDGRSYRLLGYDTPETYFAKCERERQRGEAATARLRAIIATGSTRLEPNGKGCKWGRECARLFVNGEDVRSVMIREGHARPYAGRGPKADWCR